MEIVKSDETKPSTRIVSADISKPNSPNQKPGVMQLTAIDSD